VDAAKAVEDAVVEAVVAEVAAVEKANKPIQPNQQKKLLLPKHRCGLRSTSR